MPARRWLQELFGAGRGRVLVFCWLGWVFDFYDLILFAFLQHAIGAELGLDDGALGIILGTTLAATAVGGVLFGRLADRRGRRFALTTSILIYSAGTLATAFAGGFWTLLLARLLTGVGVGGEWGIGHAIVAETYPERLRGRAAGILQAGSPVAMMLAALVFGYLSEPLGWRNIFLLSALPALLVVFARAAIPGPDRAPGRDEGSFADLFRGALLRPSVALLVLLALHMSGFWCVYSWLPRGLIREAGATPQQIALFFVGVNSMHVIADVAFGFLADRFGRRRMFALFCALFAVGQIAVALLYRDLWGDLLAFGVAIALMGLGAGTWSCFGVLFAESYPASVRATAAASFYNLARGVQLFTQPLMAWLLVLSGTFAVALYVGAAMAVASGVVIWFTRPGGSSDGSPDTSYSDSRPAAV